MKLKVLCCCALVLAAGVRVVGAAEPLPPGIFGVGFTNVTDSSARLVFTTSEPMTSTVVVSAQDKEFARLSQPNLEEIHEVALDHLTKGQEYNVIISGVTHDGKTVTSESFGLRPELHPASTHDWPGYTIFSSSVCSNDPESLEVLAKSGVRMTRIEMSWDNLFPKDGKTLNQRYFNQITALVAEVTKRHIEPLVVLDYCVPWAKPYTATTMTWRNTAFGPPDKLADWDAYVRFAVSALRGSVKYYEVWNEPDAGYLATGSYVERPDLPPPIGRPPFKDNWHYWIGDRYAPMIGEVRKIVDELEPGALVMNGGWNRDYSGGRGDVLLERGIGPDLDVYCFHTYAASPLSFSRWYGAIDTTFRANIDRIFDKHHVRMPLAVSEWGYPAWEQPPPDKGFVSFEDAQKFYVKSTFYFLGLQRMEILSQFCIGIGPDAREKDPAMFALANRTADGKVQLRPTYTTFQWLATTFGSKPYRVFPVQVTPSERVKAYALQLKESGDTYLAVWQDGVVNDKGAVAAEPAQDVTVSIPDLPTGKAALELLGLDGNVLSKTSLPAAGALSLKVTLPDISASAESGIYLARIGVTPK